MMPVLESQQLPLPTIEPRVESNVKPILETQRFLDFSLDILILVSRLPKTRAGRYLADQLLRTGTAVGAKIQESEWADTIQDHFAALQTALKNLRETGYWLMLVNRSDIMQSPILATLEKTCQDLITLVSESRAIPPQKTELAQL
jgi:four helix bundle protein